MGSGGRRKWRDGVNHLHIIEVRFSFAQPRTLTSEKDFEATNGCS